MRLIDREKGKILGINAFDLFLLLILITISGYYVYENLIPPPQEVESYSGLNIRNAALEFTRLSTMGYVVRAEIDGVWTSNGSKFHDDVLLTWSYETRLFGWYKGKRITIGGPNAYVEDIAASTITFKTESPSVIRLYIYPIEAKTIPGAVTELERIAKAVASEYGVRTIKVRSSLILSAPGLKPDAYTYNQLRWEIHRRIPYSLVYIYLGESYITFKFDYTQKLALTTENLMEIGSILEDLGIDYESVILDAGYVYVGTDKPLTGVAVYENLLANARPLSDVLDVTRLTFIPKP